MLSSVASLDFPVQSRFPPPANHVRFQLHVSVSSVPVAGYLETYLGSMA